MSVTCLYRVSSNFFLIHFGVPIVISLECALADYVSGIQSEKVPFVFLPIQGQLINPNAEIALSGILNTVQSIFHFK